jgi:hypothetical protein
LLLPSFCRHLQRFSLICFPPPSLSSSTPSHLPSISAALTTAATSTARASFQ